MVEKYFWVAEYYRNEGLPTYKLYRNAYGEKHLVFMLWFSKREIQMRTFEIVGKEEIIYALDCHSIKYIAEIIEDAQKRIIQLQEGGE